MIALPLAIPWFTAVVLALTDARRPWTGWVSVAALAASFLALVRLAVVVLAEGPQEMVSGGWPPGIGIALRVDALGITFALVTTGALLAALVFEVLGGLEERLLPDVVLFLATGLTGLFLTGDVFSFYVFFEIAMTASFVLAGYGHEARQIRDSLIFTLVNLLGSVMFLAGIAALYHLTGTLDMKQVAVRLSEAQATSVVLTGVLFFTAFGLKLGLFPFHFWLPPVYRGTRPAVAAMLSGAVANIGSYGLLRFGGDLLRREVELAAPVLLVLAAGSILYGAVAAVSRSSASGVLAFSSISQAGYILLAIAVGGTTGYLAAVLYALLNSLDKTLLFLTVGLRGRLVAASFAIGAFSVAGLPPSAGFFGKVGLFHAALAARPGALSASLAALIFLGGALSFLYMFRIFQRDFWEERPLHTSRTPPTSTTPLTSLVPFALALLVLAVGLWPEPLLALSRAAAAALYALPAGGR